MAWRVEFLDETVREELDALPRGLRAKLHHVVSLIEAFGLQHLREPHAKRVQDKLWEIRLRHRGQIARVLYVTASGQRVVLLHAFKKTSRKTPRSAIRLALARAKEINS